MIFAAQTRQLRYALEPHGVQLVYATGPFECEPGYGVSPFFDDCGPFYCWSPNDPLDFDIQDDADNVNDSAAMAAGVAEMLDDLRYEYGDDTNDSFVGILGFSSAASVAAGILAAQQNNTEDPFPTWCRFRFGVLINGTGPPARFSTIQGDCGKEFIKFPTVSVVGKQDQWLSQSRLLNTYIDNELMICLEFDNGHKIPSKEDQVQEIVSAILAAMHKTEGSM
ncbi:citrinin biosynthesis oxidoreductase CtnB [Colletotrichum zoysiae]|uniref:Citrinin biosynthesis oxidoreductase CtnB n=1 Tax=Colletotrichum zoysiae TaxID=1216348 RepID=A0AAD9HLY0_9PEZI|nr:citrinin biosynthesis oxidoreductase CtnB [Colletotrichum zoysiae]